MNCKFDIAYRGRCGTECNGDFCPLHQTMKCCGCGGQADHECDYAGQFVCGAPLCKNCEGKNEDSTKGLGWGFIGHVHKPKAIASHIEVM